MTEIRCPEDDMPMYSLRYQKRQKTKNSEKTHGQYQPTNWYWCEGCKRPVQVKILISEKGFK